MNIIYSLTNNIKYFYNNINPATLTGAIDVIVVEQPDGSLRSTPFHVRFGKYRVFSIREKYVDITINNEKTKLKMKLAKNGVAYFVKEIDAVDVPEYLATSPLPESPLPETPAANDPTDSQPNAQSSQMDEEENQKSGNSISGQSLDRHPSTSSLTGSISSLDSEGNQSDSIPVSPILTPSEIKKAVEKKTVIELEMLAGTNQMDSKPNTHLGQKMKERLKSDKSIPNGNYVSDEETVPLKKTNFIRSLHLSSDELKALQLQYGSNEARFSVTTHYQGTSWCICHIYLFKYYEKIVISDIDGTITKSDVLGHVIAAIGGKWAHAGVAELYTRIKNNGYKMVYLSSRAIGQSHYTKTYLQSFAQGSKTLPDGPVLLSPISVLMAFKKEVIERKPEEFKIACLTDLKNLFPVKNPFYAGFGNRETDVRSYAAVDIPPERILIINPSGTVKRPGSDGFSSNYQMMAMIMVDYLFPPLQLSSQTTSKEERSNGVKNDKMRLNFSKSKICSTFTRKRRTAPAETVILEDELTGYERKRKEMAEKNKKSSKKKSRK